MSKQQLACTLCAVALLSLLAACAQTDDSRPDVAVRRPFRLDNMGGEGAEVSWEGYTDGYYPGTVETMHLAVKNHTNQPWNSYLCVQLLEAQPSSMVIPLADQEIDLEPGRGFARDLQVDLPEDLPPGIYGLALVVHKPAGPIVDVIPVQVGGSERAPFQGTWPTAAALEACAAPQASGSSPMVQLAILQ